MVKRALFIFDWQRLSEQHLIFIDTAAAAYDELIFVIHRADEEITPLPAGRLMEGLQSLLRPRLKIPFYLFPIAGKGQPHLYSWLRYKLLCPSFEKIFVDNPWLKDTVEALLHTPTELVTAGAARLIDLPKPEPRKRGLFVTRAQPFHLGHAAFIRHLMEEQEEAIIVIGMANKSHLPNDFATGGERLEMLLPWLTATYPGRFYLAPFAYSDHTMENLYELQYLLPPYQTIYTINPLIEAMAETAGYATRSLTGVSDISGTRVRELILQDQPYGEYMPEEVYNYFEQSPLPQRLKKLHEKETR